VNATAARIELEERRRHADREVARGGIQVLLAGAGLLIAKVVVLVGGPLPLGVAALGIMTIFLVGGVGLIRLIAGTIDRKMVVRRLRALGVHELPSARARVD
jgi:hypothetical protein